MTRPSPWMVPVLTILTVTWFGAASARAGDLAWVYLQLQPSATDSGARGDLLIHLDERQSLLQLRVRGLEPDREYLLLANDVERTRFTSNANGMANLQLRYPASDANRALEFDPRGKLLAVNDGSEDLLSAVVSGPMEPRRTLMWELAAIPATENAAGGRARGAYWALPNGWRSFEVRLWDADPAGSYDVVVDGALVGKIQTNSWGRGMVQFWSVSQPFGLFRQRRGHAGRGAGVFARDRARLDFEPRGAQVEIVRDGEVVFAGSMRAQVALPEEAEACPLVDIQIDLTPLRSFGSGDASLASEDGGCDLEFQVTARGLAAANYELWVGDAIVGMLPVRNWLDGLRGELRFDTQPEGPDELLLDFDPRGQPIEVRRPQGSSSVALLGALFPTQ